MLQTLFRDVRYALRSLRTRPGFTVAAVLTLALGIGANTSLFSVVNGLLLRPLPVKEPGSLVAMVLFDEAGDYARQPVPFPLYRQYVADAGPAFSELFAYATTHARINSGGRLRPGSVQVVSGNFFDALGVPPQLGRAFMPDEDAAPMRHAVAVISDGLWKAQFRGDAGVVGRTVVLEDYSGKGLAFVVVGVAPANFRGLEPTAPDVWVPSMMHAHFKEGGPIHFRLMGRLKPGVSRQAATLALQRVTDAIGRDYGGRPMEGYEADAKVERGLRAQLKPAGRGALGAVPLVRNRVEGGRAVLGRGRHGAADRLRQHRQPAAGAGGAAAAGVRRTPLARRRAGGPAAPGAGRERGGGTRRRCREARRGTLGQ